MNEWKKVAELRSVDPAGQIEFNINITGVLPENEVPASARQIHAIESFYGREFPNMMANQAHALLCYREYARLSAETLFPKVPSKLKTSLTVCVAAFISQDDEIAKFARRWSERNFANGVGSPRVKGTPFFPDLQLFSKFLLNQIRHAGIEISQFH